MAVVILFFRLRLGDDSISAVLRNHCRSETFTHELDSGRLSREHGGDRRDRHAVCVTGGLRAVAVRIRSTAGLIAFGFAVPILGLHLLGDVHCRRHRNNRATGKTQRHWQRHRPNPISHAFYRHAVRQSSYWAPINMSSSVVSPPKVLPLGRKACCWRGFSNC